MDDEDLFKYDPSRMRGIRITKDGVCLCDVSVEKDHGIFEVVSILQEIAGLPPTGELTDSSSELLEAIAVMIDVYFHPRGMNWNDQTLSERLKTFEVNLRKMSRSLEHDLASGLLFDAVEEDATKPWGTIAAEHETEKTIAGMRKLERMIAARRDRLDPSPRPAHRPGHHASREIADALVGYVAAVTGQMPRNRAKYAGRTLSQLHKEICGLLAIQDPETRRSMEWAMSKDDGNK